MATSGIEAEITVARLATEIADEMGTAPSFDELGPEMYTLPPSARATNEFTTSSPDEGGSNGCTGLQGWIGLPVGIILFRMVRLL